MKIILFLTGAATDAGTTSNHHFSKSRVFWATLLPWRSKGYERGPICSASMLYDISFPHPNNTARVAMIPLYPTLTCTARVAKRR